MSHDYPRNVTGYGPPPKVEWPGGARLALSFVLNYEEAGEANILDGDLSSENYLCELVGIPSFLGRRNYIAESIFQYGSRAGVWRLLDLFGSRSLPLTIYGVGLALERNPAAAAAFANAGHEIASHAWRWIDYSLMPEDEERRDIQRTVSCIERLTGARPVGWYTGRFGPNTRRLIVEEGGFLYDSDAYDDDLPYWVEVAGKPHLIIPYTLDCNDGKYSMSPGWMSGDDFFAYLKANFDCLYREGRSRPKMMSVGLHCRLSGRPGRAEALARFLDYVQQYSDVWVCRRSDIARYWITHYQVVG
jgi:putative urate catabolism protein